MSFSSSVKAELCTHTIEKACCARAFCYGAASFAHTFLPGLLEFHTEHRDIAHHLRTAFSMQGIELHTGAYRVHGHEKMALSTAPERGPAQLAAFLRRCGIDPAAAAEPRAVRLLHCPDCLRALLAGAFLTGGVISNPEKEYHIEFISPNAGRLDELERLLADAGFEARRTRKNGNGVVYLRASEQIEDLLTCMGASHSTMEIMNEKIYKNYRNQANRITNCETANIDKTVAANERVLQAVHLLRTTGLLGTLPEPLQQAALARAEHPDLTLAELAAGMRPPVSKSGLSHRLKKLEETAAALGDRQRAGAAQKEEGER